jgi:hypothetical protein
MAKHRKQYSSEEKVSIIRRHLVEKVSVSDLCQEQKLLWATVKTAPKMTMQDSPLIPTQSFLLFRERNKNRFFLFIPVVFFLPLACMIFVITPKEDQDETKEVSLLSDQLYPQPASKAASEDLRETGLSESSQSRK